MVFGANSLARLGDLACELGFKRTLLVADPGLVSAGHVDRATGVLANAGIEVVGSTPSELAVAMKSEMTRMGKLIKDARIRAN